MSRAVSPSPSMSPHPHTVPRSSARDFHEEITRPGEPPESTDDEVTRPAALGELEALVADTRPPEPERRTPGSPYKLDANPLAGMSDDVLRTLVDDGIGESKRRAR